MPRSLKVRAHHLLCLQGFQGHGYDDDFVAGMRAFLKAYESDQNLEFEVSADVDAICAPCPHRDDLVCRKDPDADRRIKETDRRVLAKLGLVAGVKANARILIGRVNAILKSKADVAEICGTCPWTAECLWYGSRSEAA